MTKEEKERSLKNAREAAEWLNQYTSGDHDAIILAGYMRESISALIAEFQRLDAKEQKQIRAGRKYGKLGAEHGKKGGRPALNVSGRPRKA